MTEKILQKLRQLEEEYGFQVLYACESGSRAWGFASADSDYDVRFLYVWPKDRYLGIFSPPDSIDLEIDVDDLDFSGWDLRKALPLFRKSNGPLLEWLFSPIVYFEDDSVLSQWRELVPTYFSPGNSIAHYLGLSRKIHGAIEETGEATAKKYLYVLRALLSAAYIIEKGRPPLVEFARLQEQLNLPTPVRAEIERMISEKATGSESDGISRNEILDRFIEEKTAALQASSSMLDRSLADVAPLDEFFRSVIA
ncbi:MAG: nucleotidyltransferase domain-containing protein [Verrucomicrobiales bacterium]|nr:nucleotidyltransferase domain-containing protein [Verrucomicrobiales bacterium]